MQTLSRLDSFTRFLLLLFSDVYLVRKIGNERRRSQSAKVVSMKCAPRDDTRLQWRHLAIGEVNRWLLLWPNPHRLTSGWTTQVLQEDWSHAGGRAGDRYADHVGPVRRASVVVVVQTSVIKPCALRASFVGAAGRRRCGHHAARVGSWRPRDRINRDLSGLRRASVFRARSDDEATQLVSSPHYMAISFAIEFSKKRHCVFILYYVNFLVIRVTLVCRRKLR